MSDQAGLREVKVELTVRLQSGGSVVVTFNLDVAMLTDADRAFVLDLARQLAGYGRTIDAPTVDLDALIAPA